MEFEFDKYCVVDASPNSVLPSVQRRSKVKNKNTRGNFKSGNDVLSLDVDDGFSEIRFHRYRSVSCKNISSNKACLESYAASRRGSVYQSSKERQMMKTDANEGRKKIEISHTSATTFSFGIVDSLCSSDEESSRKEQKRSSVLAHNSDLKIARTNKPHAEIKSRELLGLSIPPIRELSSHSGKKGYENSLNAEKKPVQDCKIASKPVIGPLHKGNGKQDKDSNVVLNKSLSAKLALPHSPAHSESGSSRASSPKARFTPARKMFDPFVKSKSHRSPVTSGVEGGEEIRNRAADISKNKAFRKSLLPDFSSSTQSLEYDSQPVNKRNQNSPIQCSPAHLHGFLKLENQDGVPYFKFEVKFLEEVLVTKTWKVKDSSTWVYTFHSIRDKRKSNASGRGSRDSNRDSAMVGQMQVSCYLCKQPNEAGPDKLMVTEFVLYDIYRLRRSDSFQDHSCSSPDLAKVSPDDENSNADSSDRDEMSSRTRKSQSRNAHSNGHFDLSTSHPLAAVELRPNLESAAIVIQVPFEKRESLKFKSGDTRIDQPLVNLLDLSEVEQNKGGSPESLSPAKVNVVIPSGNHGLPTSESCGPSSLLDRFRLGGGCDCGGWDMACPLHVFDNSNVLVADDHRALLENQFPFKLFFQGKKDNAPALTMMVTDDRHYAVDFHAQLSALQAFSICISILHTIEASSVVSMERNKQIFQSDPLRVFVDDEIKSLIDAVMEVEKCKVDKKAVLPSFIVNPPFSPIARV